MTEKICAIRDDISRIWHDHAPVHFGNENVIFGNRVRFEAFCAAKDLLQDSTEALLFHRRTGFGHGLHQQQIELWGVMQALAIQQDAICQLHFAITGEKIVHEKLGSAWAELRNYRHYVSGHPVSKSRNEPKGTTVRCVSRSDRMSYEKIPLVFTTGKTKRHVHFDLGNHIDAYEQEASKILLELADTLSSTLREFRTKTMAEN